MRFRIKLFRTAVREVDEILDWFIRRQKAPAGAEAWYRAYNAAIANLRRFADRQSFAPEDEFVDFDVRQVLFKTQRSKRFYRIVFTIVGDQVRVMNVRGPGQDLIPPERLIPGDGT